MARRGDEQLGRRRPRSRRTGRFASDYEDARLIELLSTVAREARPDAPQQVTQAAFDLHAPAVAKKRGWPAPPSARAIHMRLGDTNRKRGWRELVSESLLRGRDPVQHAAAKRRARPEPSLDEAVIHYALRRVAQHLGKTPTPDEYERGRRELIERERRRRRDSILAETLPTNGQIETYAGVAGWQGALRLAGLPPREAAPAPVGIDPVTLAWHYYESRLELPAYAKQLHAYARELGILLRDPKAWTIGDVRRELERRRAERGWATPDGPPAPEERLTGVELEHLLADARPIPERWTLARALDALVHYLDAYEHEPNALRQKSYRVSAVGRGWPPPSALTRLGKKHGIQTWAEWLEAARRHRSARRRAA